MKTIAAKVSQRNNYDSVYEEAAGILTRGGLVAFPTETVYGLGGFALNPDASKKIYEAKGRPSDNPLIVHIASKNDLASLVKNIPEKAYALMDVFWPGPFTMIFEKSDRVPPETSGGLSTVAVRFPNHPVAIELIKRAGPLAAPSANVSGTPSPTRFEHVFADLNGKIDMILDGGNSVLGLESTILDVTKETPEILRPGFVTAEEISHVCGDISVDSAILDKSSYGNRPKAPGQKYTHYAPHALVTLVMGGIDQQVNYINKQLRLKNGKNIGVMATEETKNRYNVKTNHVILSTGSRADLQEISGNLFHVLRKFDELGISEIYAESFQPTGLGLAIMNRLYKACGYRFAGGDFYE